MALINGSPNGLLIVVTIAVLTLVLLSIILLFLRLSRLINTNAQSTNQQVQTQDVLASTLAALVKQVHTVEQQQQSFQQQLLHANQTQREASLKANHDLSTQQQARYNHLKEQLIQQVNQHQINNEHRQSALQAAITQLLAEQKEQFNINQLNAVEQLVKLLTESTKSNREELSKSLIQNAEALGNRMTELTQSTDRRLQEIGGQVEKRLSDGFEKTTKTFNDILQRLALIDDAQKKITELSTNVVSLQEVLADKRTRGAFGEVQLTGLIRNVLPEQHFSLQHTLSNGKIADCVMFLPEPTGNVVIDAKFPLESFRKMMDNELADSDRAAAKRQFKQDIKKHINDIASKYILEKETSDGALMFIPAEAVFAEIHAHHADMVEYAYQSRVWFASPTTLMAILTTARSVIKDEATRQQVHLIQEHLIKLGADFGRFRNRFDNLAKHIDQAASDVKQIHTSASKISNRFEQIEKVDLADKELDVAIKPALTKQV